ncbi:16S rRNA (uracil(1498)-N(3))-methyltransferase [Nereida sp. MMG025]|uniref:16S rRNA (uracil(1498)-N(3))-methyltransferase n=1 Tax=Nereida sp. MMG025 TaxID=2909981 RepID=UPI001F005C5D|nr:16S rRNA (uracil(1498)-N(3))-methyltransferase [Nereida sp. MMG025]MCF6444391.1 16S rRNA (uracil(1498)-N(3))-methyltransferase [Nereida sp. MMG025]
MSKVRLYVDHPLGAGQTVPLDAAQAHYLFGVMRLGLGDVITVFDGVHGAWSAVVVDAAKRRGAVSCQDQTAPQQMPPDLWLLFAPIKKARTDFIVEKATEMGAARICPVQTDFTNADRIKQDRLQAHAVEAAEQCGGTFVPPVDALAKLTHVLDAWDPDRALIFCDEALVGRASSELGSLRTAPAALLIGPEGGFSQAERARLVDLPFVQTLSLGPRVLRADTAAVAALSLWQHAKGDWR